MAFQSAVCASHWLITLRVQIVCPQIEGCLFQIHRPAGSSRAQGHNLAHDAKRDLLGVTSPEIDQGVVQDVKFKCMGYAVAIACSSMATEMVLGKSVEAASQIRAGGGRRAGRRPGLQDEVQQPGPGSQPEGD
jgi:hypothetical protein